MIAFRQSIHSFRCLKASVCCAYLNLLFLSSGIALTISRSLNPCTFNIPGNVSGKQVTGSDCWEELSVSSSNYSKYKLTDGQSHTYWESSAEVGKNWIHIKMKSRTVIRYVVLLRM